MASVTTGRQALATIQRAVAQEEQRTQALEAQLSAASQQLAEIDVQRGEATLELARLRVQHLEHGGDATRVADADARVLAMLEARQASIATLRQRLDAIALETTAAEDTRDERADALERANALLDEAEAATQARLEGDPAYRAARQQAEDAARIAQHADEKASQSEEERASKERAYQADPLFMYLWRRRYGTSGYRAGGLTRWLDSKVARHVRFGAARANYARLQELPVRLREHAERVAEQANAALEALTALDEAARTADGIDAHVRSRDDAVQALAEADGRLDALAREREAGFEELDLVARGEDDAYQQALTFLASELGREDLRSLRRQALATPFPEDDVIVARLIDLKERRNGVDATLRELKEATARQRQRLREVEQLRGDFTRGRMDQPGTTFADGTLVATVLSQFLQGALARDALWRVLEQQRRQAPQRSDPNFGSGGFGRGSPWSSGTPRSRPVVPAPRPSSGRSGGGIGGGGFRTGGTIGGRGGGRGGGFRTGGKF